MAGEGSRPFSVRVVFILRLFLAVLIYFEASPPRTPAPGRRPRRPLPRARLGKRLPWRRLSPTQCAPTVGSLKGPERANLPPDVLIGADHLGAGFRSSYLWNVEWKWIKRKAEDVCVITGAHLAPNK